MKGKSLKRDRPLCRKRVKEYTNKTKKNVSRLKTCVQLCGPKGCNAITDMSGY